MTVLYLNPCYSEGCYNEVDLYSNKAEPLLSFIFVRHFSFLFDKNLQTVGQLSSNYSGDFAKTGLDQILTSINGCNSVANLPKYDALQFQRRSCQ